MENFIESIDQKIINAFKYLGMPTARIALCVVFFWFGILKIFDSSPANQLVNDLLSVTIPFIAPSDFIFGLGIFEMIIGVTFIVPRLERLAIFLLLPHIFVTAAPLFLLKAVTWQSAFIPTLEGQYIIKNLLIIATAVGIAAHLEPIHHLVKRIRE